MKISWKDHVPNETVLERAGQQPLSSLVAERRFRWLGHLIRLPDGRPAKHALKWIPEVGKRKQGSPKQTWRRTVRDDLRRVGLTWENCLETAKDKVQWKKLSAQCSRANWRT